MVGASSGDRHSRLTAENVCPLGRAGRAAAGGRVRYRCRVTVLETLGVYVLIPLVIVLLVAALTLGPGRAKARPRYRPGESWDYPDQFWAGDDPVVSKDPADRVGTRLGGARGTW